jgi:hypothetical protein
MTTEAMVAAAKAVVPSCTAQEVYAKLPARRGVVILDAREQEEDGRDILPRPHHYHVAC